MKFKDVKLGSYVLTRKPNTSVPYWYGVVVVLDSEKFTVKWLDEGMKFSLDPFTKFWHYRTGELEQLEIIDEEDIPMIIIAGIGS